MHRLLLLLVAAGLIALALVLFTEDAAGPSGRDLLASADGTAAHDDGGGHLSASGVRPRSTAGSGDVKAAEPEPTGPYEFRARSAETERPLAGVEIVTVEGDRLGTTGPSGSLRIEDAEATLLSFRATLGGYLPHVGYAAAGGVAAFSLQPGISIAGRVIRATDGVPAARARLRVWDVDFEREIAQLSTDGAGRFVIPAVRPNRPFVIVALVKGLVSHRQTETFAVSIDDLEVRVGTGGVLTGIVYDPEERPWAERAVRLVAAGEPLAPHRRSGVDPAEALPGFAEARETESLTDEEGRFTFVGLPRGEALQPVVVLGARYEARGVPVRWVDQEQALESDIRVPHPARLRIFVEDDRGRTLRGADVHLRSGSSHFRLEAHDRRPDGSFLARPLTPTTWRVLATLPGTPAPTYRPESVTIAPGGEGSVTVIFAHGSALTGRVIDKRGDPVWGAHVSWAADRDPERAFTRTDHEGRFRLERLRSGSGTVTVTARDVPHAPLGFEKKKLDGVAPTAGLEIRLNDGTALVGRFPELSENETLYATLIPGTGGDAGTLWLDKQRRFRKRGPAAPLDDEVGGPSLVIFRTPALPPLLRKMGKPFGSEERRDLGDLYFNIVDPYLGRVLDPWNKPIQAAKVTIQEPWSRASQRTDRDGYFEFARVPEQRVRVLVEALGYPANRATLLPASQRIRQVIQIHREGSIALRVVDTRKKSVAGAEVRYQPAKKKVPGQHIVPGKVQTDAKGFVELKLKPGPYVLRVEVPKTGQIGEARVTVRAGEALEHTMQLESWYQRFLRERKRAEKKRRESAR